MINIQLRPAVIGLQGLLASWAAQDLEGQPIGNVIPFTFSQETGFAYLFIDFIPPTPLSLNAFDSQDLEALPYGAITSIPATVITSVTPPPVELLTGSLSPLIANVGDDDLESYPAGAIAYLKNSSFSGDITMQIGFFNPPI